MEVRVFGATPPQEKIALAAVNYSIKKLIPVHLLDKLSTIDVRFKKLKSFLGRAFPTEKPGNLDLSNYTIEISNCLDGEELYATVAHECVHVKQFFFGQYYGVTSQKTILWNCERIRFKDVPHEDLPWEKEANKIEAILKKGFKKIQ